jgi:succinoglycan biosynthesis transport protein ExoP
VQLLREKRLALENSDNEYKTALTREKLLSDAYDVQKHVTDQLNESNIHYNILKREVDTNKQLYDGLLQRMKEAGVAAGLKSSNIRIVDQAEVPTSPASNDLKSNLYLALFLGLTAGLGLAFFMNYLDNNIKTPEDVEEKTGLPTLGLVPSLQSSTGRYGYYYHRNSRKKTQSLALMQKGVELASLVAGSSPIAEAYRGLRTALLLSMPNNPPRTIMITSCKAGEGKTTTVCNTAISLAQAGKKVLIIDADMRRPKIRRVFNGNGSAGLSEYLTGQVEFDALVQETSIPNLFAAYAGAYPPNPGELLGSNRMRDALDAAVKVFDFVLIDTPPMMSVTDPVMVAPMADGVILVIKGGKNAPDIVKRAKKNLELVRARIIGVLCNNVDLMHSDYHHYLKQYTDYSAYVTPDAAPRANA